MSLADADLTCDAFLDGRLRLWQPRIGYRAAIDPVLLAAFVPARSGERVLELGCGAGTAALCLAARVPGLALHGLELQPAYAALARRNAEANGIALAVHEGDLRRPPAALRALTFDQVLANPPFHPAARHRRRRPGPRRRPSRGRGGRSATGSTPASGGSGRAGAWRLIHRTARLGVILAGLEGRAGAVEIVPLAGRAGHPAERVLVRARKGSRAALVLHPPFTLHEGSSHKRDGESYTEAAQRVLRGMEALSPGSPPGGG